MKLALALASTLFVTPVLGAPPAPCENAALIRTLGHLAGGPTMKVSKTDAEARLDLMAGPTLRETVLRVSCDTIDVPFVDHLDRPTREAATRVIDGVTVSRTARGAVSLDFPAGLADRETLQVLVMDDDAVSVVRGDKIFYAFATLPDGSTVETEGIGNGCGCERTTDPAGKVAIRRLPR